MAASHAESCKVESRLRLHGFTLYKRRTGATADEGGGCDQSIGSTVCDAIVRSWLWSTTPRSSPLGCSSRLQQVVDNIIDPIFCSSKFSTGRLLAIESFTLNPFYCLSILLISLYLTYTLLEWRRSGRTNAAKIEYAHAQV